MGLGIRWKRIGTVRCGDRDLGFPPTSFVCCDMKDGIAMEIFIMVMWIMYPDGIVVERIEFMSMQHCEEAGEYWVDEKYMIDPRNKYRYACFEKR